MTHFHLNIHTVQCKPSQRDAEEDGDSEICPDLAGRIQGADKKIQDSEGIYEAAEQDERRNLIVMPVLKRQPGAVPTLPLVNGGQEEADEIKCEPNIQGDALPPSGLSEILTGNAHEKSSF